MVHKDTWLVSGGLSINRVADGYIGTARLRFKAAGNNPISTIRVSDGFDFRPAMKAYHVGIGGQDLRYLLARAV